MFPQNVATGLYCNWDSFIKVNDRVLRWVKESPKAKPKGVVITSEEEVVYALNEGLVKGGREFLISEDTHSALDRRFSYRRRALGGNGFHMGRALCELGLHPLVSYPSRPRRIMLASPEFKIATKNGIKSPQESIREGDPEYDHVIFEFVKNEGKGVLTSGRQIFSWDLMSSVGMFDEDFLAFASDSKLTDVLIIGYAHLLLPEYTQRTDVLIDHLNHSKRPRVHFELGRGSDEAIRYAIKKFADYNCADSWGLNENEFVAYFNPASNDIKDLIVATIEGVKKYGLKRICVHSSEFAFSVSKFDVEKERQALETACLVAASLTFGSIKKNLDRARMLPRSEVHPIEERVDGYNLCLVPAFVNSKPTTLTGLGDTFAGTQAGIILNERRAS